MLAATSADGTPLHGDMIVDVVVSQSIKDGIRDKAAQFSRFDCELIAASCDLVGNTRADPEDRKSCWVWRLCERLGLSAEVRRDLRSRVVLAVWAGNAAVIRDYREQCRVAQL
ncbi:hypothetical protein J8273_1428 [Carpediemonas membranifera]|uniref:Uncharacterized protein n=1 Tax=Carpediemonas membranifera TaxID=201153 RepID=A0A8J6C0D0_9EUKA|nr:hypothetical protein J8273_1428 [Carpediemonas membranifera]|eukprot:KAG9396456.1 hypothetical protein J8273_1428 [Carpediemonas membranifera]